MTTPFVIQPRATVIVESATPADDSLWGELATYVADENVTDIFINGASGLFVDRGSGAERIEGWRGAEREVRDLAVKLISAGGRHIDDTNPCIDVRLRGGVRVHCVLSPVSRMGTAISIRIPRVVAADLPALRNLGNFDEAHESWLLQQVQDRANLLITGGAGAGKTTLLSALLAHVSHSERIITIEDVAELSPRHPHHISLEARQGNLEGAGSVSLSQLVRESLRMRPDRLVVGECRGEEVRELLTALNTGHDGGAGTMHASSLADVPARLEALGALAGMDATALARQVVSAFTYVIQLERSGGGERRICQLGRFAFRDERLQIEEVCLQ
jgi:pilus assembly protein CpaF